MFVCLNESNQFGNDGPQRGAHGIAHDIRQVEDETWVVVTFPNYTLFGACHVPLKFLLWPNTEHTETVYSTLEGTLTNVDS